MVEETSLRTTLWTYSAKLTFSFWTIWGKKVA
nr:MAG TPA: hypothetical protein [Caudoviricetes sp.]